jgi:hypothetical protein
MFTYSIEKDPIIVVIVDPNGNPAIHQPHHPNAENFAPWTSETEAEEWAESHVELMNNPPADLEAKTKEEIIAELEAQLAVLKGETAVG